MIVETRDKQIKLFGKLDIWSVTVSLIVRMAFLGEICKKIKLSSEKRNLVEARKSDNHEIKAKRKIR